MSQSRRRADVDT